MSKNTNNEYISISKLLREISNIKEYCKDKTSIVITHDPNVALQVADRIIVLHEGKIVEDEKKEYFVNNLETEFYRFVQSENLK